MPVLSVFVDSTAAGAAEVLRRRGRDSPLRDTLLLWRGTHRVVVADMLVAVAADRLVPVVVGVPVDLRSSGVAPLSV